MEIMNRKKFLITSTLSLFGIPLLAADSKTPEKTPEKVYFTASDTKGNYICEVACEYSAFKTGQIDILAKVLQRLLRLATERGATIHFVNASFDGDKTIK